MRQNKKRKAEEVFAEMDAALDEGGGRMTRWTEEQGRAIALSERRLLISAAAGSGKTAVLTERIVSRVLDETRPVDIDRLLIMTFTRAAAAEMRGRIRRRMERQPPRQPYARARPASRRAPSGNSRRSMPRRLQP